MPDRPRKTETTIAHDRTLFQPAFGFPGSAGADASGTSRDDRPARRKTVTGNQQALHEGAQDARCLFRQGRSTCTDNRRLSLYCKASLALGGACQTICAALGAGWRRSQPAHRTPRGVGENERRWPAQARRSSKTKSMARAATESSEKGEASGPCREFSTVCESSRARLSSPRHSAE